jgi:hypothetical protein
LAATIGRPLQPTSAVETSKSANDANAAEALRRAGVEMTDEVIGVMEGVMKKVMKEGNETDKRAVMIRNSQVSSTDLVLQERRYGGY